MSALFLLGLCLENNVDSVQPNNQHQTRKSRLRESEKSVPVRRRCFTTNACRTHPCRSAVSGGSSGSAGRRASQEHDGKFHGQRDAPSRRTQWGTFGGLHGICTESSTTPHGHLVAQLCTISTAHQPGHSERSPEFPQPVVAAPCFMQPSPAQATHNAETSSPGVFSPQERHPP